MSLRLFERISTPFTASRLKRLVRRDVLLTQPAVFRQLLKYINTGTCDLDIKTEAKDGKESKAKDTDQVLAAQLLAAADRFQVADLAALCCDRLGQNITELNVLDLLMIADKTNAALKVCFCAVSF